MSYDASTGICSASPFDTCIVNLVKYYQLLEYSVAIITLFLGSLIVFVVLFRSPKEMVNYKWFIINVTMWDIASVIFVCLLFQPVPLFPATAAIVGGPLRILSADSGLELYVVVFGIYIMSHCSVNLCFAYRHALLQDKTRRSKLRLTVLCTLLIAYSICSITAVAIAMLNGQRNATALHYNVLKARPHWAAEIEQYTVIGFSGRSTLTIFFYGGLTAAFGGNAVISAVFFHRIQRLLRQLKHSLTVKTYRMHCRLTLALATQIVLPLSCSLGPLLCVSVMLFTQATNDIATWFVLFPTAAYHPINFFVTLYFVDPYRQAALLLVRRLIPRRKPQSAKAIPAITITRVPR